MSQPAWPWAHLPSTKHNIFSESLLREDLWIVKELWWSSGLWYGQLCCCEANLGLQLFKPLQVWSVTDEDQLSGILLSAVSHRLEKCCWWDWDCTGKCFWESKRNRAFCFWEEGEDVGVEQKRLFPGTALQRVPGDSPPPISAAVLQWASCEGRLWCYWAQLVMTQTEEGQNSCSPFLGLAWGGYSCSGLGTSRVYYAEGNTLFSFVALPTKQNTTKKR